MGAAGINPRATVAVIDGDQLVIESVRREVLAAIEAERGRQVQKFGDQSDCPDADPHLLSRVGNADLERYGTAADVARVLASLAYEVPSEARAHDICEGERADGGYTWFGIVLEEVCEALDAIPHAIEVNDPKILLAEVEQCATVFVAWAEAIRRRGLKRDRSDA